MAISAPFSYNIAFGRNLGWLTEPEQFALRGKCVAVAGLGGVGGVHLLTLTRLGIGAFHIADLDTFELANLNRQVGATMQTIGRPKVEVLDEMARAINPELRIERFDNGVTPDNIDRFLLGVDLFIDGLDFFALDIRRRVFARCAELDIPAITAAPIGMGAAYLAFAPRGMTFDQYFRLEGQPENEQYLRFLVGLTPKGLHRKYLADPSRVDLVARRAPSTIAACELCAGVTAVTAAKLLLGRGDVRFAPYHQHYDAYRGRMATTRLIFGNAGPLQQLKLVFARNAFGGTASSPPATGIDVPQSPITEILDAARWAPSGDNAQPWRFELLGDNSVAVHLESPGGENVYEYRNGEPLLLSCGMLLECLRIAATAHGMVMEWLQESVGWPHRSVVRFTPVTDLDVDPLCPYLGLRSVDRRRYKMRPLLDSERIALKAALGDRLVLEWFPQLRQRWQLARLTAQATDIRLRTPEAFPTHQRIVDWERKLSPSGIPAGALGLDRPTLSLMHWAIQSWERTLMLNRLGSTTMAALQMDYVPILASAACFTVRWASASPTGEAYTLALLQAGQNLQRFWLTAMRLGLAMQPMMAPLIFADYGANSQKFTNDTAVQSKAKALAESFRRVFGTGPDDFVFIGRIGERRPRLVDCRSVRQPLATLIRSNAEPAPGQSQ